MNRKRPTKAGIAVVEMAVCLPIIFTVIFASIEACNMIALKQIISESAYDGALTAVRPGAQEADIVANINAMLAARSVTPQSVQLAGPGGASFAAAVHGDSITVTVDVLTDGNVIGPQLFGFGQTLSSRATAVKQ